MCLVQIYQAFLLSYCLSLSERHIWCSLLPARLRLKVQPFGLLSGVRQAALYFSKNSKNNNTIYKQIISYFCYHIVYLSSYSVSWTPNLKPSPQTQYLEMMRGTFDARLRLNIQPFGLISGAHQTHLYFDWSKRQSLTFIL